MKLEEKKLLDNHLAFLASHRGSVERNNDTVFIKSDRPEFTYTLLGETSKIDDLPASTKTVQHFPWSQISADDLKRAGFKLSMGLSYMTLEEPASKWRTRNDLNVMRVEKQQQMDTFSDVQSRGFNETTESFERWHPWLKAANDRNLKNSRQLFYVGSLKDVPVGTVLTVFEGESAGIYAVATVAEHRRKQ
jgi:hypothetical protein